MYHIKLHCFVSRRDRSLDMFAALLRTSFLRHSVHVDLLGKAPPFHSRYLPARTDFEFLVGVDLSLDCVSKLNNPEN